MEISPPGEQTLDTPDFANTASSAQTARAALPSQRGSLHARSPEEQLARAVDHERARLRGWVRRRQLVVLLSLPWGWWCWTHRAPLTASLLPASFLTASAPHPLAPVHDAAILLPSTRRLTDADLKERTDWELTLMRNEPYARHGYRFGQGKDNAPIYAYFAQQPWYKPDNHDLDRCYARMSQTEQHNVRMLLHYQNARRKHNGAAP